MDLIRYYYTHLILRVTDDLSQNTNWRREFVLRNCFLSLPLILLLSLMCTYSVFFQLLPCFVLLFYHSGLIIICNTVTFSLNRVFSVKKRDKQTKRNLFFYLWWVSSRWIMSIRLNWIIDWTIFGITIISSYFIFSNSSICVPFSNGFRLSISKVTTWGLSNSYTKLAKRQFMNWLTQGQFAVESSCDTRNLNELSLLRWKCQTRSKYLRHLENG